VILKNLTGIEDILKFLELQLEISLVVLAWAESLGFRRLAVERRGLC
jgi:hypothetical protein